MVNFVLRDLDTTSTMQEILNASGDSASALTNAQGGMVDFYVSTATMREVFQFQSDATDINNETAGDIAYTVDQNQWPTGNAGNFLRAGRMHNNGQDGDALSAVYPDAANEVNTVMYDYIRHLTFRIFGMASVVDILENELELRQDIASLYEAAGNNNANSILFRMQTALQAASGATHNDGSSSMGEILMNQLLADNEENRFEVGTSLQVDNVATPVTAVAEADVGNLRPIPFVDGDVIQFVCTLSPPGNICNDLSLGLQAAYNSVGQGGTDSGDGTNPSHILLTKPYVINLICGIDPNQNNPNVTPDTE